jgi:hypothetical protein
MAKRVPAGAPASIKSGTIVDIEIARTATAKDIHATIDRLLNLRGCRPCGLIGKISIYDQVARPVDTIAKEIAGDAAGIKVRVIG